jgi:hypothetical protein
MVSEQSPSLISATSQFIHELASTSVVIGPGRRNKFVTAIAGRFAAMHHRSALGTFFLPWFCVSCGDDRLARLRRSFFPPHSFFVCLQHRTLWVNAARRIGHVTTDGTMLSIRSGLQRLWLLMHVLLRVSVKGFRACVKQHTVSLRSPSLSPDTTEWQPGSVFGFANVQQPIAEACGRVLIKRQHGSSLILNRIVARLPGVGARLPSAIVYRHSGDDLLPIVGQHVCQSRTCRGRHVEHVDFFIGVWRKKEKKCGQN